MTNAPIQVFTFSDAIGLIFCGAILLLLFIVSFVFFNTRRRIYLYYSLFLFFSLVYALTSLREVTSMHSTFFTFLHGNLRFTESTTILSFAFYIFFSIPLIDLQIQAPKIAKALQIFGLLCIGYSMSYFILFTFINAYHIYIFITTRIIIFTVAAHYLIQLYIHTKSPVRTFFIIGSICYFIGSVIASLRFTTEQLFPVSFYDLSAPAYFQIGILLQALFFALAMGEKVVIQHKELNTQQRAQINQLATEEKWTKELNKQLEDEIEARVNEVISIREHLEEQERKRINAEHERNMLKSEIQIKQAQVNPHFIFNSLNAIKYLILQNENKKAIKYLVTFSRFIRGVLEQANTDIISLESEIAITNDYLELEKKRFDENFNVYITKDLPSDMNNYYTPPFLLQPFIENAIWHGLLPSTKREKNLSIQIKSKENRIIIVIEDNGVGRNHNIKKSHSKDTGSLSIELTLNRLELFNLHQENQRISHEIIDLKDANEQPIGTKVVLYLEARNDLHSMKGGQNASS